MNILYKRPLFATICVALGGFVLFAFLPAFIRWILLGCLCLLLGAYLFFLPSKYKRTLHLICLIAVLASAVASTLYFGYWFRADKRFAECDDSLVVSGTVKEVRYNDGFFTTLTIKTRSINQSPFSRYLINVSAENGELSDFLVGDGILLEVRPETSVLSDSVFLLQNAPYGISMIADACGVIYHTDNANTVWRFFDTLRTKFEIDCITVAGENAGGLLCALLSGNRSNVSSALSLHFKRIGASHILALSGMHLSILSFGVYSVLSLFGFGKKSKRLFLCIFVILFVVFTGASASLLRAGIMLLLSSAFYFFRKTNDLLTTLSISVSLIVLFVPYSVFHISLWLSAISTFGLLLIIDYIPRNKVSFPYRVCRYVVSSFLMTFGALFASLICTVFVFGEISILSPISTLFIGFLTEIYILFGIISLLFSGVPVFSGVLQWLYSCIDILSQKLSVLKFACVDSDFLITQSLSVLFALLFFIFLVFSIKNKKRFALVLIAVFISVYASAALSTYVTLHRDTAVYYLDGTQESIICISQGSTLFLDLGHNTKKQAETSLLHMQDRHLVYLDTYVVTSYSVYSTTAVKTILSSIQTNSVWLPYPSGEYELERHAALLDLLERYNVDFFYYDVNDNIYCQNIMLTQAYRNVEDSHSFLWFNVHSEDINILYMSRGSLTEQTKTAASLLLADANTAIFGSCGYMVKDTPNVYSASLTECIISDSYMKYDPNMILNYKSTAKTVFFPPEYKLIR